MLCHADTCRAHVTMSTWLSKIATAEALPNGPSRTCPSNHKHCSAEAANLGYTDTAGQGCVQLLRWLSQSRLGKASLHTHRGTRAVTLKTAWYRSAREAAWLLNAGRMASSHSSTHSHSCLCRAAAEIWTDACTDRHDYLITGGAPAGTQVTWVICQSGPFKWEKKGKLYGMDGRANGQDFLMVKCSMCNVLEITVVLRHCISQILRCNMLPGTTFRKPMGCRNLQYSSCPLPSSPTK